MHTAFERVRNLYLLAKNVLDFWKDRVCVILQNAGDSEEIQATLESSAIIYFKSHRMSCTMTLLIASISHRKVDRPYINPLALIYIANI